MTIDLQIRDATPDEHALIETVHARSGMPVASDVCVILYAVHAQAIVAWVDDYGTVTSFNPCAGPEVIGPFIDAMLSSALFDASLAS